MICLVAGASASLEMGSHAAGAEPAQISRQPVRRRGEDPRPVLDQIRSPAAERVAGDADRLWEFLTDPKTPFADRLAAALHGADRYPPKQVGRLMQAIWELREEERLHRWGMKRHPHAAQILHLERALDAPDFKRARVVLGRRYDLPREPLEYPLTWKEEQQAPWPWQTREALEVLFNLARPRGDFGAHAFVGKRKTHADAWLAACMRMPLTTEREVMQFVEASAASSHYKTLPVLARWRRIALDPRFPHAASQVAGKLGDAMRLWDDPRAHGLGQVLIADVVAGSPHLDARHQAAYGIRSLRERFRAGKDIRMPEPALALVALGDAVQAAGATSDWNRLYCFAFSAAEALDRPPIEVDRHLDTRSPQVAIRLTKFKEWFRGEKMSLQRTAEAQLREIAAAVAVVREPLAPGEEKP